MQVEFVRVTHMCKSSVCLCSLMLCRPSRLQHKDTAQLARCKSSLCESHICANQVRVSAPSCFAGQAGRSKVNMAEARLAAGLFWELRWVVRVLLLLQAACVLACTNWPPIETWAAKQQCTYPDLSLMLASTHAMFVYINKQMVFHARVPTGVR